PDLLPAGVGVDAAAADVWGQGLDRLAQAIPGAHAGPDDGAGPPRWDDPAQRLEAGERDSRGGQGRAVRERPGDDEFAPLRNAVVGDDLLGDGGGEVGERDPGVLVEAALAIADPAVADGVGTGRVGGLGQRVDVRVRFDDGGVPERQVERGAAGGE